MPSNTDEKNFITEIRVYIEKQGDKIEEDEDLLRNEGFHQIPVNLTKRAGGDPVFLWYRRKQREGDQPITNIQFSFCDEMIPGLECAQYIKADGNLNYQTGGDPVFLWYKQGCSEGDVPIVDLFVTSEQQAAPQLYHLGWERLACNLNRGTSASRIFLWLKRAKPTYVSEILGTAGFSETADLFIKGFFRMDENINNGAGGNKVFLWYRLSTDPNKALKDLSVSVSLAEGKNLEVQGFTKVLQDLNDGTEGSLVNVWYKKEGSKPIKTFTVIDGPLYKLPFQRAGVQVIDKNLNEGTTGAFEYLCFYQ